MVFKEVEKDGEIRKYAEELTTIGFDKRGQPIKEMVRFYVDEHIDSKGKVSLMAVKHIINESKNGVGMALVPVDKDGKTIEKTDEEKAQATIDKNAMLDREVAGRLNRQKTEFTGVKQ